MDVIKMKKQILFAAKMQLELFAKLKKKVQAISQIASTAQVA